MADRNAQAGDQAERQGDGASDDGSGGFHDAQRSSIDRPMALCLK